MTKRNIERRLDQLSNGEDYPTAGLCQLLSTAMNDPDALDVVDADRRLWRVDGEVKRVPQATLDILRGDGEGNP